MSTQTIRLHLEVDEAEPEFPRPPIGYIIASPLSDGNRVSSQLMSMAEVEEQIELLKRDLDRIAKEARKHFPR